MTNVDWLWGALAGATATYAATELHERLRLRRTVDGAAIDLAREVLDWVPYAKRELERAEDYQDWIPTMGDLVTAEVRDKIGRVADHVDTRLRDPRLTRAVREVHTEIGEARVAARDYDSHPLTEEEQRYRHWDEVEDTPRYAAFVRVHDHVMAAADSTDEALERMAELERSRPRR